MGQNKNSGRKLRDQPIIKIPQTKIISELGSLPEITAEKCPPSFEEPLEESPFVIEKVKVFLELAETRIVMVALGNQIGFLSKRNSDRVSQCLNLRIKYIGEIFKAKSRYYARFYRQTD
ncbi:hypothetical protein [Pseudoflavitalea rhizosphaerae]|uniref:hypothetical protein n=1 Tax=Pseudoflavitalea rhizosphaerae TaxID=1884793 RepID=UPI000F8E6FEF|nr:hypothetical protein [Pseudoflavitalea rhizosphaerae]